jgi:hypothetical protein
MRSRDLRWLVAAAALVLLFAGDGASAPERLAGYGGYPLTDAVRAAGESSVFYLSGGLTGLYPGESANLVLTISNPQGFGITVQTINIWVNTPSAGGCAASNLSAPASVTGLNIQIAAGGSVQYTVQQPVTLLAGAPDACQGVSFPLVYGGSAIRT